MLLEVWAIVEHFWQLLFVGLNNFDRLLRIDFVDEALFTHSLRAWHLLNLLVRLGLQFRLLLCAWELHLNLLVGYRTVDLFVVHLVWKTIVRTIEIVEIIVLLLVLGLLAIFGALLFLFTGQAADEHK